jgi:predicted NAD/FAD-binding protein
MVDDGTQQHHEHLLAVANQAIHSSYILTESVHPRRNRANEMYHGISVKRYALQMVISTMLVPSRQY